MTRRRRAHKHAHAHIRTDARAHTQHGDDNDYDDYHIHTARIGRGIFFFHFAFTYGCAACVNVPGQLNDSPKSCAEYAYGTISVYARRADGKCSAEKKTPDEWVKKKK